MCLFCVLLFRFCFNFSLHRILSSFPNCCMSCLVKQVCERPLHSGLLHQLHQFVDHMLILCHFLEVLIKFEKVLCPYMLIWFRYFVNILLCLTECQSCATFVIVTTCHSKQECCQTNVFSFKMKHI